MLTKLVLLVWMGHTCRFSNGDLPLFPQSAQEISSSPTPSLLRSAVPRQKPQYVLASTFFFLGWKCHEIQFTLTFNSVYLQKFKSCLKNNTAIRMTFIFNTTAFIGEKPKLTSCTLLLSRRIPSISISNNS